MKTDKQIENLANQIKCTRKVATEAIHTYNWAILRIWAERYKIDHRELKMLISEGVETRIKSRNYTRFTSLKKRARVLKTAAAELNAIRVPFAVID